MQSVGVNLEGYYVYDLLAYDNVEYNVIVGQRYVWRVHVTDASD